MALHWRARFAGARRADAPEQGFWLTLDAGGEDLPGDWRLRLAGGITRRFRGEIEAAGKMPLTSRARREQRLAPPVQHALELLLCGLERGIPRQVA